MSPRRVREERRHRPGGEAPARVDDRFRLNAREADREGTLLRPRGGRSDLRLRRHGGGRGDAVVDPDCSAGRVLPAVHQLNANRRPIA